MSVVTIQVGQCGNQLGCHFLDTVRGKIDGTSKSGAKSATSSLQYNNDNTFFRTRQTRQCGEDCIVNEARAVLIDMEPKVIENTCAKALKRQGLGSWAYDPAQTICRDRGSGNNWAAGFNEHGPACLADITDAVRREVERCDAFAGFNILQSVAGGTGSGVGAFISGILKDEYRPPFLLNNVVWPYESGDVIVQNYNAVLTLAELSAVSDGIVIFENDVINQLCLTTEKVAAPTFEDLNATISRNIANAFIINQRTHEMRFSAPSKTVRDPFAAFQHVCRHPGYKLLTVKSLPQTAIGSEAFTSESWEAILKHLYQMHITGSAIDHCLNWRRSLDRNDPGALKSIASSLILRDTENKSAETFRNVSSNKFYKRFYDDRLWVFVDSKIILLFN